MASNLKITRSISEKVHVRGTLSDDATYIIYVDENKEERNVQISDLLQIFKGEEISFTVGLKSDEDLDINDM